MIVTPPPYVRGQPVKVRCPSCQQTRWIQWDTKYLRHPPGRCHPCAALEAEVTFGPRHWRILRLKQRRRRIQRFIREFGLPWKPTVLHLYHGLGLSLEQTGQRVGVSKQTILNDLIRWGEPRRSRGGEHHHYGRHKNPERAALQYVPLP